MSSIKELEEALSYLSNISRNGMEAKKPLGNAGMAADALSQNFKNINTNLSNGWDTTKRFAYLLQEELSNKIHDFMDALEGFVEATEANERRAEYAVNTANEEAERILKELGLL